MSDPGPIRWERDADGVVTLVLDDPASTGNTMDAAFRGSLAATVTRLEHERDEIAGVVVTSAQRTFLAGGDLAELRDAGPADRPDLLARVESLKQQLRRLETLGRPVVAAINGTALGGGLELALACHHRVLLDGPQVRVGLPEVTLGLMPGAGGVVRTVRLLGLAPALTEVLLRGPRLRPARALELGLVHELATDPADLRARARAFIEATGAAGDVRQPYDQPGYRVPGGTPASPGLASVLPAFPATLVKELKGAPYPAPRHILAAAVEGLAVDVDTALTIENRYFVDLAGSIGSTNMIQALWFDLNQVNGGGARPAVEARPAPGRVAVLGAGMMGAGIAQVLAGAGLDVVLEDLDLDAATHGRERIATRLAAAVRKGHLAPAARDAQLARIVPAGDPAAVAGCDAVIEAVFEDEPLKHRVLAEVEPLLAPDALLATNTSTLPVTGLAAGVSRPDAFVGLHFFSPVDRMPLVEIVVGAKTSEVTLARAYDLVRTIGKTPIVVDDRRGFFTSRVFATLVLEGAALVGEGLAAMSVERAALGAGFPAGPLTLMDEVSLTLMARIARAEAEAEPHRARLQEHHPGMAVVHTLIEAGRTGKACGAGFFDWNEGKRPWPGLVDRFHRPGPPGSGPLGSGPLGSGPLGPAQERMLFAMAIETARCLEEGVLRSVPDANVGSILGIGFPPLYGGALQYVDQYAGGVVGFVTRARDLAARHGERFDPPVLLTEHAVAAGSLRAARP